jgi:hypothetical protein
MLQKGSSLEPRRYLQRKLDERDDELDIAALLGRAKGHRRLELFARIHPLALPSPPPPACPHGDRHRPCDARGEEARDTPCSPQSQSDPPRAVSD